MERWEDRELRRKREGERTRVEEGTEKWTERQDEEVIRRGRGGKVQEERGGEGGGGGWHSGGKRKRSVCLRHICSGGELPDSHQTPAEWQSPLLSQVAAFFFFFFLPSFPILSFLGREHFASLALRRVLEKKLTMRGDFHTWQSIFSTAIWASCKFVWPEPIPRHLGR